MCELRHHKTRFGFTYSKQNQQNVCADTHENCCWLSERQSLFKVLYQTSGCSDYCYYYVARARSCQWWAQVEVRTCRERSRLEFIFCWTWAGLGLLRVDLNLNWTFAIGLALACTAAHSSGLVYSKNSLKSKHAGAANKKSVLQLVI